MTTKDVIEGLTILEKYHDGGLNVQGEHDKIYVYCTPRPVDPEDVKRLVDLDWEQYDVDTGGGEFSAELYDAEESWTYFT